MISKRHLKGDRKLQNVILLQKLPLPSMLKMHEAQNLIMRGKHCRTLLVLKV